MLHSKLYHFLEHRYVFSLCSLNKIKADIMNPNVSWRFPCSWDFYDVSQLNGTVWECIQFWTKHILLIVLLHISCYLLHIFCRPTPRPQMNNEDYRENIAPSIDLQKQTKLCCGDQGRIVWILLLCIVLMTVKFVASLVYILTRMSRIENTVRKVDDVPLLLKAAGNEKWNTHKLRDFKYPESSFLW